MTASPARDRGGESGLWTPHHEPPRLPVVLAIEHRALRQAIRETLSGRFAVAACRDGDIELGAAPLLLSTPRDIDHDACAALVERGYSVVILAALPRAAERIAYEAAGARRYLEMNLRGLSLVEELRGVAAEDSTPDGPLTR